MRKASDATITKTATSSAPDPRNSIARTLDGARRRIYNATYKLIEHTTDGDLDKLLNLAMAVAFLNGVVFTVVLIGGVQ